MTERVRFGVLGCAAIAVNKVIPAMVRSTECEIVAIGSRAMPTGRPTSLGSSGSPAATARTTPS